MNYAHPLVNYITRIDKDKGAFCGLLNFKDRKFACSNHGHPAQYLYKFRQSEIVSFHSQSALLGLPLKNEVVYQHKVAYCRGNSSLGRTRL